MNRNDVDSEYMDAMEDTSDYFRNGRGDNGGSSAASSRSESPAPNQERSLLGGIISYGWNTAKKTTHAVMNPISTTKELAGSMATSAQQALARTLGVDPEIVGKIMTKPLELLMTASNETRELTSLWIQFLVSVIDVLRTQEVSDLVGQYQDTGNSVLQILRSEEFSAMKDSLAAFISSEESTLLVKEVANQSQRITTTLRTEEARESTRRLLAFVTKVVSLADDVTNATTRRSSADPLSLSPGRPRSDSADFGSFASWADILNKIDDMNEMEDLLTDHEAMRLRRLCRSRNQALLVVWVAYMKKKDEKRLLRGLREVLEDTA